MKALFIAALHLILVASHSAAEQIPSTLPEPAILKKIAKNQQWKQLLLYDASGRSVITSKAFFLSANGARDPYEELLATLRAFANSTSFKPDAHPQCRFAGRYHWLDRQLNLIDLGIQPVDCPSYLEFSAHGQAKSISLIFATGYLGNPASYYGHLLLKINLPNDTQTTDLESTAVNFGADVPVNENMLLYISKGIFGGYDSSFTHQQYFYHSHNYGESQQRDMWEYEMEFSKEDLNLLIAHIWEVMGADYTYYFFNRNCAYRMGELLELVTGNKLVESWRPWETPQTIVQKIGELSYKGKPLVQEITYHPSRQSRLYQRYKHINNEQRKLVHHFVQKPEDINNKDFSRLDAMVIKDQYEILDTLLDYYQFIRKEKEGNKDINNEYYRQVLLKRYRLPPGDSPPIFSSENKPHLGRKPSYISLGGNNHDVYGEGLNIWLRPAYYDSLDAGYGHIKNASLSMAEITLGIRDDQIVIRQFNVVKIESLRRNLTGLPGDRSYSWYLDVGAEEQTLGCSDCLATKARSGIGYATSKLNDTTIIAGFIGGGFLEQSLDKQGAYASALITLNLNLHEYWTLRAETEQRFYDGLEDLHIHKIQTRIQLSPQLDARFYVTHAEEKELGFSVGTYW